MLSKCGLGARLDEKSREILFREPFASLSLAYPWKDSVSNFHLNYLLLLWTPKAISKN